MAPPIKTVFEKEETLRDKFAGKALSAILSSETTTYAEKNKDFFCEAAYAWADAMMKARDNKN